MPRQSFSIPYRHRSSYLYEIWTESDQMVRRKLVVIDGHTDRHPRDPIKIQFLTVVRNPKVPSPQVRESWRYYRRAIYFYKNSMNAAILTRWFDECKNVNSPRFSRLWRWPLKICCYIHFPSSIIYERLIKFNYIYLACSQSWTKASLSLFHSPQSPKRKTSQ